MNLLFESITEFLEVDDIVAVLVETLDQVDHIFLEILISGCTLLDLG